MLLERKSTWPMFLWVGRTHSMFLSEQCNLDCGGELVYLYNGGKESYRRVKEYVH